MRGHGLANRPGQPYPTTFHISVDRPGIEPGSPARRAGVVPLDHQPVYRRVDRTGVEPTASTLQGSSRPPVGPCQPISQEVRPGVEPGLPPYRGGVLPKHLQTISATVIPDGVEPALSWLSPRRLCRWTTGSCSSVTEVGVEPTGTRLSTSPLCQFAYPVVSGGSGSCTRRSRLMRPG